METVLRVISTMVSLLPVVLAMLAMLTMLTTVRVGWMAPRMVNLMVRSFLALGRCIGAMGNVFCMLRLPSVLLLVKMVRPLIVGCPMAVGNRGVGQNYTGSIVILVGMMMWVNKRSTLGSTRVLRLTRRMRSTISLRDIAR